MKKTLIRELEEVIDGKVLTWYKDRPIKYFVKYIDDFEKDCLCFNFEGYDEKELLEKMIKCSAAGVVVKKPCKFKIKEWKNAGIGIIEVNHMMESYFSMIKLYREKFNIPFIQVIGSAGKTTTKNMIGSVLNAAMPTLVGYKNYNTATGIASNILSLRDHHRAAVIEAGMKGKGIMSFSSSLIKPNIGVLTSIQRAHYVTLGSIEDIIEAKSEILEYLDENGVMIINGEDVNCDNFPIERYKGRVMKYGFSDKHDLWASDIKYNDFKSYFTVRGKGIEFDCVIDTVGGYNIGNALAAVLVGLELGVSHEDIQKGLADFETVSGRLKIYKGPKDTILIDDNFNANPDSIRLLLEDIPKFAENRPIVLVLGDMERPDDEIKKYAREVHFKVGQQIAQICFEKLYAVGKWAREYVKGAKSEGIPQSKMIYFKTVEEAQKCFRSSIIPGSVIIFKASVYVSVSDLIESLDEVE